MGTAVSKAANGIGSVLGNAFVAPVKTIFGKSCEGICSGTWDILCFIEHLCISSFLRLFVVSVLTYIIMLFFYLLFKIGIIQCIGRSLCKLSCAACKTYWTALEEISCFLWHNLRNTKRVYRQRFEDIEEAFSSSREKDDSSSEDYESIRVGNRRRLMRNGQRGRTRHSLHPKQHSLKRRRMRLKTREVSVHFKGSAASRKIKKSWKIRPRSRPRHFGSMLFKN
ncbi:hypothetical protein AXF42_Ash015831 [Apostasia shenzhenica]|uniref:Uncharacterized protein n=1 Tax=Apostasia shenzhenica TaxID=1088818 RepID=A0A2H9ZXN5_9ASPA|nr:hypothetical protein AXF42_Ash015831 [Apostasia shenzhenica]